SVVYARRGPEVWSHFGPRVQRFLAGGEETGSSPWPSFAFLLLLVMAGVGGGWKLGRNFMALPHEGPLVVSAEDYPVQAVEFMLQNGVAGNLDCSFNWGEYCIFKLHPQCRVFCDGRYETVYPAEVAELALATEGEENWRRRVQDYPTEAILAPVDDAFAAWAARRDDFIEVYRDSTARLLLRRTARNASLLEAWRENRLRSATASRSAAPFPA
ncbi:MAG: hypothetical protein KY475_24240, partial [Planctomycetes bacterium]|nr:hypothetical protein [Planctomycetota bacterium]